MSKEKKRKERKKKKKKKKQLEPQFFSRWEQFWLVGGLVDHRIY